MIRGVLSGPKQARQSHFYYVPAMLPDDMLPSKFLECCKSRPSLHQALSASFQVLMFVSADDAASLNGLIPCRSEFAWRPGPDAGGLAQTFC